MVGSMFEESYCRVDVNPALYDLASVVPLEFMDDSLTNQVVVLLLGKG